jgi:hypothetical protein
MTPVHPIATSSGTSGHSRRHARPAVGAVFSPPDDEFTVETLRAPSPSPAAALLLTPMPDGGRPPSDERRTHAAGRTFARSVARAAAPSRLTGWFVDITV